MSCCSRSNIIIVFSFFEEQPLCSFVPHLSLQLIFLVSGHTTAETMDVRRIQD
jgi:hypothetical protein